MDHPPSPSFSSSRKWAITLNLVLTGVAILALVLMVNYLAARHFFRIPVSTEAQKQLSPLTKQILRSITNEVRVTIFFNVDEEGSAYDSVWALLKEYQFINGKIEVKAVDYVRDNAAAKLVKAKYQLANLTDKNLVIFDCNGHKKIVYDYELSELDIRPVYAGKEARRTHFKGELLFTSAIYGVTSARALKACFLQGHGEHSTEGTDKDRGYSQFVAVLQEQNVHSASLSLGGTNDVPLDCSLLIVAGPTTSMPAEELAKIDRYLKSGGRFLALFSYYGLNKNIGLEKILAGWGVEVDNNRVRDERNSVGGSDILTSYFSPHPIVNQLLGTRLYFPVPRSIRKSPRGPASADAPNVTELVFTGPEGTTYETRSGTWEQTDLRTNVCLAVAVEKGKIKGVTAERGTTRMVVVGDSLFLGNGTIDSAANRDFATLTINWLLDRTELLGSLGPRPIKEYKLIMTQAQMSAARWMLLGGMPGSVLLIGFLVWIRRRK